MKEKNENIWRGLEDQWGKGSMGIEIAKFKSFYFAESSRVHKEKQRGCPLLGANRYTHIYISYICVYIYIIYLFET